jgi:hypothetical protein
MDDTEHRVLVEVTADLVERDIFTAEEALTDEAQQRIQRLAVYRWALLGARMRDLGGAIVAACPARVRRLFAS